MVQEETSLLFRPTLITLTYALKRPCGIILCGLGAPHEAAKVRGRLPYQQNAQEQSHGDKSALPALQDFRIHGFSAALTKGNRGLYRKNGHASWLAVQPRLIDGIGLEHYFQSQMKTT